MAHIAALPTECLVNIFLFLSPIDIRTCRQVSRSLFNAIKESLHLQYLLELDVLGYVTPLYPLNVSFDEKVRILKEKHSKTGIQDISPTEFNLGNAGSMGANSQFSRGTFARGGPSLDITRRLNLYQPSSRNKQTDNLHYVLDDLGLDANDYRIDPDLDLLVLLEIDAAPADPDTDLQIRFHLRSLSMGSSHPQAALPIITENFRFTSTYAEPGFQIVGRLLAIACHPSGFLDTSSPRMCVWDWTTGELVASTDILGRHFAFVSEDTFVVPYDRRKWAGQDIIGSLEVYTFAGVPLGGHARHVASLHLPTTPDGPCHSSSHFVFTPPVQLHGFPTTTPARVYEIGSNSQYLCLHLRAYNIKSAPSEMSNGCLFIPCSNILNALDTSSTSTRSKAHVPWTDWASGTSWINNRHLRGSRCCVFGHRAAFTVFLGSLNAWQVLVYDLRRKEMGKPVSWGSMQRADEYLEAVFEGRGALSPRVAASFFVSRDVIPWKEESGDNPPEIMVDDEHVIVFKEAAINEDSSFHVYTL